MNTTPKTPEQPPEPPKANDIPTRAKPSRKIDAAFIAEMARLVAKMLTESEACRLLGVKPRTWFDFKSRAGRNHQFADMVEAFRASRIEQLIDRIEKSADGDGLKFPDWRAALALLKITDQRRFGDSPAVENTVYQSSLSVAVGGEAEMRRLIQSAQAEVARLLAAGQNQPKQIAPAMPSPENEHGK